jgi:excinuclease ABC subunit B
MYADKITGSIKKAIEVTNRRREIQKAFNEKHNITPQTVQKSVRNMLEIHRQQKAQAEGIATDVMSKAALRSSNPKQIIAELKRQMLQAAQELDFESAAVLRDRIQEIQKEVGENHIEDIPNSSGKKRKSRKSRRGR